MYSVAWQARSIEFIGRPSGFRRRRSRGMPSSRLRWGCGSGDEAVEKCVGAGAGSARQGGAAAAATSVRRSRSRTALDRGPCHDAKRRLPADSGRSKLPAAAPPDRLESSGREIADRRRECGERRAPSEVDGGQTRRPIAQRCLVGQVVSGIGEKAEETAKSRGVPHRLILQPGTPRR
jgi:hypothetical protein